MVAVFDVADAFFTAGIAAAEHLGSLTAVVQFGFDAAVAQFDHGLSGERTGGGFSGISEGGFQLQSTGLSGISRSGDFSAQAALDDR